VLGRAVREDQPRRDDARAGIGVARREQPLERSRAQRDVRVREREPRRRGAVGHEVDGTAVAEVLAGLHEPDPVMALASHLDGPVGGAVVDDPDLGGSVRHVALQRAQAAVEQVTCVP
jgi:hypothetical protein